MSYNPRDMINATHDALVRLGLVNDTPSEAPPSPVLLEDDVIVIPPSPVPLQDEDDVVVISPLPGTPPQQIMFGNPNQPPPVGRREIVQQRLDDEGGREQLPRQLLFRDVAETPGRLPVQRVANYPNQNLIRPLF